MHYRGHVSYLFLSCHGFAHQPKILVARCSWISLICSTGTTVFLWIYKGKNGSKTSCGVWTKPGHIEHHIFCSLLQWETYQTTNSLQLGLGWVLFLFIFDGGRGCFLFCNIRKYVFKMGGIKVWHTLSKNSSSWSHQQKCFYQKVLIHLWRRKFNAISSLRDFRNRGLHRWKMASQQPQHPCPQYVLVLDVERGNSEVTMAPTKSLGGSSGPWGTQKLFVNGPPF